MCQVSLDQAQLKNKPANLFEKVVDFLDSLLPDRLEFFIPLPPYELSINDRKHWKVKASYTQGYREECGFACVRALRSTGISHFRECIVHARYVLIKGDSVLTATKYVERKGANQREFYQPRDEDNARAALKAAQDGFMDAGLAVSDAHHNVHHGLTEIIRLTPKQAVLLGYECSCVEIIVQGMATKK